MPRTETLSRLQRLEQLSSRLRLDEPIILRDVAEEFRVSMSTINRDVALLRERGIPIEADRGRGGGVRISHQWGIGRVALDYQEALDLLISIASIEKMQIPMLLGNARAIRMKLIASFSRSDQDRIRKLALRVRVGPASSPQVVSSYANADEELTRNIHESFLFMRQADIVYRSGDNVLSHRRVEPHYLVLNYPVWYLLCYDLLRRDIRTFRCDRLAGVALTAERFALRPWSDFADAMEGNAVVSV